MPASPSPFNTQHPAPSIRDMSDQDAIDPRTVANLVPATARVLLGLAEERGLSIERLCRGLGLHAQDLATADILVSHRQTRALILRVQRMLDEPVLGVAVGARETPISLGLAGLAMLTCETLGEAVGYALEHQTSAGSMLQHQLQLDGARAHLTATPRLFDLAIERFLVEEAFAGSVAVARAIVGGHFRPAQVEFAFADNGHRRLYERFFHCPIRFQADEHRLSVDTAWLQTRLPGYDRLTSDLVRQQLNPLLRVPIGQDDLLASVTNRLRYRLEDRSSQRQLAQQVHLSERTLRRRLAQQDTRYLTLRDTTRYERACDLLRHSELSLAEIAQALGYADARSFRRAFKRWSGQLPTALRKAPGAG